MLAELRSLEPNLMKQQLEMLGRLKASNIKVGAAHQVSLIKDEEALRKEGLKEGVEWLEVSHIKGITVQRGYNPFFEMAICDQTGAWKGLVKFSYDKEIAEEKNYTVNFYRHLNSLVLRAYVNVVSPYRIKLTTSEGRSRLSSAKRFLVVENELFKPPQGALLELEEEELLKLYRLNSWSLVDIDNLMSGNPLLPKFSEIDKTYVY